MFKTTTIAGAAALALGTLGATAALTLPTMVIAGPNGRSQVAYQVSEQQGENYSQIILRYQS